VPPDFARRSVIVDFFPANLLEQKKNRMRTRLIA